MLDCFIATCSALPNLDPDDRLLVDALTAVDVRAKAAVWTDPLQDWSAAAVTVIRSTWDYHESVPAFTCWVERVASVSRILNAAAAVRWNAHKFYLRDLWEKGVPIVPTVWLERGSRTNLTNIIREQGWSSAVVKPAYGASADGVRFVGPQSEQREGGQRYVDHLLREQDGLLQPYFRSVSEYLERALVFIGGTYSHAVTKRPFMHANIDLAARAGVPAGSAGEVPVEATAREVAIATQALEASGFSSTYARVDLLRDEADSVRVLEVELIEPALYLFAQPGAAEKLARAIVESVRAAPNA
jgi:hypothetical protein